MRLKVFGFFIFALPFFIINGVVATPIAKDSIVTSPKTTNITIGFLNGGGSFVGVDVEPSIGRHWGVQVGAGVVGFGGGICYHFRPDKFRSGITLGYWHQGIGYSFVQNMVGPTYVYRAKKLFTFQLGVGKVLQRSSYGVQLLGYKTNFILLYSIGIYFGIK